MGVCYSRPPDSRPIPQLYPRYRQGILDLVNATAGSRGAPDDHVREKYDTGVKDLQRSARCLITDYERIRDVWERDHRIRYPCMEMRKTVIAMQSEYEELFRLSAWKIDEKVDERKKDAVQPYLQLEVLKDYLHDIARGIAMRPNFEYIEKAMRFHVRQAADYEMSYKEANGISSSFRPRCGQQ